MTVIRKISAGQFRQVENSLYAGGKIRRRERMNGRIPYPVAMPPSMLMDWPVILLAS